MKKYVIDMNNSEAYDFFMKADSFCTLDLPEYFTFEPLLKDIENKLNGKDLSSFNSNIPIKDIENVNYKLISNKDGKYAWRPFELIHPALYVQLVKDITEKSNWNLICSRINSLSTRKIICCSMLFDDNTSGKQSIILNWWEKFEQESIATALEFEYIACADITDCYGSIYTHTIPWAIHGKHCAKSNVNNSKLIGNKIDKSLQNMHYNQTNGIPQGSKLTDFIAEILLAYADNNLFNELKRRKVKEYKILRYRDDYKIFAHDSNTLNIILKTLTEVLLELNLKINANKTFVSDDIISNSIKNDKIYAIEKLGFIRISLEKYLLTIRDVVKKYNSSGSAFTYLKNLFDSKICKLTKKDDSFIQCISILVDIMIINPKTYSVCIAIISKLLTFFDMDDKKKIIKLIRLKFSKIANTAYLDVWLQRLTVIDNKKLHYNAKICKKLYCSISNIWDSSWTRLKVNEKLIISTTILKNLNPVVSSTSLKNNIHES